MPSSLTPGSSHIACVQLRDADAAFAEIRAARHSQDSRNPFHAGLVFRGFTGSHLLRPVRLLAPLDGSDRVSPATGGFYIQASGGSVTLPVAGYDYNSTGLLCWRDFHPQEWQLASLHPIPRAPWPITGAGGRSKRSSRPPRRGASISRIPTSFTPTGSASFSLCWPWLLRSPTRPVNGRRNTGPSSSRPTNAVLNRSSGLALIC